VQRRMEASHLSSARCGPHAVCIKDRYIYQGLIRRSWTRRSCQTLSPYQAG
jgi:hypothetical protein